MLTIWGRRNSNNVQKVLWLCEEIGLDYEHEDAGGEFGRTRDPDMLARNPNAVVPTIEDDGFVLWESNVILRYLASKYGPEEIYPAALATRADVERWMDWQQTTLLPPMTTIFWGRVRMPDKVPSSEIKEAIRKADPIWGILDDRLNDQRWIMGDTFTLAEVSLGIMAWRWFALVEKRERKEQQNLENWFERLRVRPAFEKHGISVPLT